jgi:dTDP-4-amino-4,6-dideoxygalactose transaminase
MDVQAIPFLDLVSPHRDLEKELNEVFLGAVRSGHFVGGPMLELFENDFALFCGVKHCVAVHSGTDALRFALMAAGVKNGDAVITVPNTFIATTEAISQAGAMPIFVDIDERTFNIDPIKLERWIKTACRIDILSKKAIQRSSGRTVSAIIPVHLFGQMCNMDAILDIAHRYHLAVVEDACQAHGAQYNSRARGQWCKAGSLGTAAAFSFYPGKNLGALGEGGAITTNDEAIARECRMLRDHGQSQKYYHEKEGYNGRLDAIQAGMLAVKLKHLNKWNETRRTHARRYCEKISLCQGVVAPFEPEWSRAVYHLFVVRVKGRDRVQKELADQGIGTGLHYPVPLHLQKAYAHLGYGKGSFPVTESIMGEILSLPMYPQLTEEHVDQVVRRLKAACSA